MKHNWESFQLGQILLPAQEPISINFLETYKQIKLRMNHNGVDLRELRKGSEIGSKQYSAKQGQFIISKIDARNGAMGIVPEFLDGAIVTGDFLLFDFNEKIADGGFKL